MIAAVKPNNLEALAHAVGHPEWIADPRFSTIKGRAEHWDIFLSMLEEWASTRSTEECEAILTRASVPCSRFFTVREALEQPHFEERKSFVEIDDGAGPLKVPNPAFKFERAAVAARNYVPALGADNADVLSSVLGYSNDRIASLYERRILRSENDRP